MAYKASPMCGGLRYNVSDFTEVNGVITNESMEVDVYTPTYSSGVTAEFNADVYADSVGEKTTTYTATVVDTTITWSDGTSTAMTADDMADVGISNIQSAVNGSTITITHTTEEVPRTELIGEPIYPVCGGQGFDGGIFKAVKVKGFKVITTVDVNEVNAMVVANCSLMFDADKFNVDEDKALIYKA